MTSSWIICLTRLHTLLRRLNDELSKLPESLEGKYFRMQHTYDEVKGYFDAEPKVKSYIKEYVDMVHELENLKNEIESDKSSIATAVVSDESALDPIRDSIKANEEKYKKLQNELENFYKENNVSQDELELLLDTQLYRQYTEKPDLWDVYSDRMKRLEDFLEDYEDTVERNSKRLRRKEMEQADVEKRQAIAAIDTKYNDMIKEENDYYDKLEEALKAKVSIGQATEAEVENNLMRHNDRIKAINEERRKAELKADKEYRNKIEKADEEHNNRMLERNKKAYDYIIQDTKSLVTAADAIFENHGEVRNSLGIIDLGSTKKNLEQAKLMYTTAFRDIENEQEKLIEDLQNEDISFGDFTNANNELNEEAKYVKGKT